jgi:hypothetical protein
MTFPPIFPPTKAALADRIDQGRGVVPADLVLKGGRVFDLVTGDLVETDVAICGDTIVGVFGQYQGRREVDVTGKVLVDQHRVSGGYRRGERVDNQQNSQEGNFTSANGYPCHRRINRAFGLGQRPTHR